MKTTVINVRGRNRDELIAMPDFCYVGRWVSRTRWVGSDWGNPFKVGMKRRSAVGLLGHDIDCLPRAETLDVSLAVKFFRAWVAMPSNPLAVRIGELRGKVLGCWCVDWDGEGHPAAPCHAVVLAGLADAAVMEAAR